MAGISFGGFLIKRVADLLAAEFPRLRNFATLSPIPGFRAWLDERFAAGKPGMLTKPERLALGAATTASGHARASAARAPSKGTFKEIVAGTDWVASPALNQALKAPVLRLCAEYLITAKREDGRARDAVAHFHLSNGARIECVNWLADKSAKGLKQSVGVMVNYLYDLADIEANHEAYSGEGTIAASGAVKGLI